MSKSKINKRRRFIDGGQPWFWKRLARNRVRDRIARESRRINRGTK